MIGWRFPILDGGDEQGFVAVNEKLRNYYKNI